MSLSKEGIEQEFKEFFEVCHISLRWISETMGEVYMGGQGYVGSFNSIEELWSFLSRRRDLWM